MSMHDLIQTLPDGENVDPDATGATLHHGAGWPMVQQR
jgi:hypothetical protein